ncbi:preprotein translocase subunit SecG [Candidatus Azambacteria bacterium]|nr:preprotein translocase subunit SecG [Candidatus Azambacteria bacterium]
MFNIALITISVLLVVSVLLQQKNAGAGSMMGGSGGSENIYQTRRGADKFLFIATIILAVLFLGVAFARLVIWGF